MNPQRSWDLTDLYWDAQSDKNKNMIKKSV